MKTHEHDVSRWIVRSFCWSTAQEFEHRMQMIDDAHADLQVGVSRRLFRPDNWDPMASHGHGVPGEDQGSSHGEAERGTVGNHGWHHWHLRIFVVFLVCILISCLVTYAILCFCLFFVWIRETNKRHSTNSDSDCLAVQVRSCSPFLPPFDAPRNTRW